MIGKAMGGLPSCTRCGWRERTEQSCRQLPGQPSTACSEASGHRLGQVNTSKQSCEVPASL